MAKKKLIYNLEAFQNAFKKLNESKDLSFDDDKSFDKRFASQSYDVQEAFISAMGKDVIETRDNPNNILTEDINGSNFYKAYWKKYENESERNKHMEGMSAEEQRNFSENYKYFRKIYNPDPTQGRNNAKRQLNKQPQKPQQPKSKEKIERLNPKNQTLKPKTLTRLSENVRIYDLDNRSDGEKIVHMLNTIISNVASNNPAIYDLLMQVLRQTNKPIRLLKYFETVLGHYTEHQFNSIIGALVILLNKAKKESSNANVSGNLNALIIKNDGENRGTSIQFKGNRWKSTDDILQQQQEQEYDLDIPPPQPPQKRKPQSSSSSSSNAYPTSQAIASVFNPESLIPPKPAQIAQVNLQKEIEKKRKRITTSKTTQQEQPISPPPPSQNKARSDQRVIVQPQKLNQLNIYQSMTRNNDGDHGMKLRKQKQKRPGVFDNESSDLNKRLRTKCIRYLARAAGITRCNSQYIKTTRSEINIFLNRLVQLCVTLAAGKHSIITVKDVIYALRMIKNEL